MRHIKAGFIEAPCRLYTVDGRKAVDVCMNVREVKRDLDETTLVGIGCFKGFKTLVLPNGTWVGVSEPK